MIVGRRKFYGNNGEYYQTHILEFPEYSAKGCRIWHLEHHNGHCKGLKLRALACREIGDRGNIMVLWALLLHQLVLPMTREDVAELLCDIGWLEEV